MLEPYLYGFHIAAGCGINDARGEATLTPTLAWCLQVQETTSLQVNVAIELC